MTTATLRQEKAAAVFDSEVWPLLPERGARLILDGFAALVRAPAPLPAERVKLALELGCATGALSLEVARRLEAGARLVALDPSPAAIARAEARFKARRGGGTARVAFQVGEPRPPFPAGEGTCDLVYSNLALAEALSAAAPAEPSAAREAARAALGQVATCLAPGGALLATFPVHGCWREFLDLFADVLAGQGRREALAALQLYRRRFPRPAELAAAFESAGLVDVTLETTRWELLFKSAREFFFAPVVEFGPLPAWQQIAGGRGDDMQDVFFFVKEAIDTYFTRVPFGITLVVSCVKGRKP